MFVGFLPRFRKRTPQPQTENGRLCYRRSKGRSPVRAQFALLVYFVFLGERRLRDL